MTEKKLTISNKLIRKKPAKKGITSVTERNHDAEVFFSFWFENSKEAIFLINTSGLIIDLNNAAAKLFGYALKEIKSQSKVCLIDSDDSKAVKQINKMNPKGTLSFIKKNGEKFCASISSSPYALSNGATKSCIIIHEAETDNSQASLRDDQNSAERKKYETLLRQQNEDLEAKARDLALSNEELEQFAYVASHDLQEPLRMITSFLQLLEKKYNHSLDDQAKEYIHYTIDGADRMKKLIIDLLEYSRAGTLKAEHTIINMNEIVSETLLTFSEQLKQPGTYIHTEPLPEVKGVKSQLLQLLQNLISNSLKYKKASEPVHITIAAKDMGNVWQFSIADNGIGIKEKFFNKIFIIFQRLHNRNEYSGTGIGLAICKKILERHGGKIWVASEVDKGSTFFFNLPKK